MQFFFSFFYYCLFGVGISHLRRAIPTSVHRNEISRKEVLLVSALADFVQALSRTNRYPGWGRTATQGNRKETFTATQLSSQVGSRL